MPLNIAPKSNPVNFKKALNKLGADSEFRDKAMKHPETLTTEFHLSLQELFTLRQAAILSGVDMTAINKLRASELAHGGVAATDINISCCCCCCCGETGVVRSFA